MAPLAKLVVVEFPFIGTTLPPYYGAVQVIADGELDKELTLVPGPKVINADPLPSINLMSFTD